jgi:ADP-ribosylation factor-like protein 1
MGLWISRMLNLFGDQEARILVLGLDNAGKTTILCALSLRPPLCSCARLSPPPPPTV